MKTKYTIKNIDGQVIFRGDSLKGADLTNPLGYTGDETINELISAGLVRPDLSLFEAFEGVLTRADLSGANLWGADLSGAIMKIADLSGANLTMANLTGANLKIADLTGANLSGAKLFNADLTGACIDNTNFTGADLRGIILKDVKLHSNWGDVSKNKMK